MNFISVGFSTKESLRIDQAIKKIRKAFNDPEFMEHVYKKTNWTYTDCVDGKKIFEKIRDYLDSDSDYFIHAYYKRWSKAHGYVLSGEENQMHVNRKFRKSVDQYAGTILHEVCHSVNYGHGSNSPTNKGDSIPYFLGTLIRNWIF